MTDPLTRERVTVLWVKGSGGDLGSMKLDGFATLYLDKLHSLKALYRGLEHEDEMVELFDHCTFNLNPRAASIDTPLHGFVPHAHVDHVHSDAVIAIAASKDAERLTARDLRREIGYLPWQRPGFDLGLKLGEMAAANPEYCRRRARQPRAFHLGPDFARHATRRRCGSSTTRPTGWQDSEQKPSFGGAVVMEASDADRKARAHRLMPMIRGRIAGDESEGRPLHRCAGSPGIRQLQRACTH